MVTVSNSLTSSISFSLFSALSLALVISFPKFKTSSLVLIGLLAIFC